MTQNRWKLKPESLRAVCDPDKLGFETTLDLTPLKEKVVGQERARHALEFGLAPTVRSTSWCASFTRRKTKARPSRAVRRT